MFENPRRGRQARNFTTNVSKILDLKSSSEQIFFRKLSLGAPAICVCNPLLFYRKHTWLWVHYLLFLIVEGQWWNQCFEQLQCRSDFSPENHITPLSNFAGRNSKRGTQNPSKSLKKPGKRMTIGKVIQGVLNIDLYTYLAIFRYKWSKR